MQKVSQSSYIEKYTLFLVLLSQNTTGLLYIKYPIYPKYSQKSAIANSVDHDQNASISIYTLFHSINPF